MKIIEITISYEATQSLSDYSNVRPGIRLTAALGENEDYEIAQMQLLSEAKSVVQSEIDRCLILDGKAPRYYAGPRFQVLHSRELHVIVIMPNEADYHLLPGMGTGWYHAGVRKMALDQARRVAADLSGQNGFAVVDCSNGDLAGLAQFMPAQAPDDANDGADKEITF